MKKIKPTKAWAVIYEGEIPTRYQTIGGAIYLDTPTEYKIYQTRSRAKEYASRAAKIIPVLITPLSPNKRKK